MKRFRGYKKSQVRNMNMRKYGKGNYLKRGFVSVLVSAILISNPSINTYAAEEKYVVTDFGNGYNMVTKEDGKTLTYSPESGVTLLKDDGYAFKDLNKNGKLDTYEDWRLDTKTRATGLADIMVGDGKDGIEAIAGLMLYSPHPAISSEEVSGISVTGTSTDAAATVEAIIDNNIRHLVIRTVASTEIAAKWNNNMQKLVEGIDYGIPFNNSSDPRK